MLALFVVGTGTSGSWHLWRVFLRCLWVINCLVVSLSICQPGLVLALSCACLKAMLLPFFKPSPSSAWGSTGQDWERQILVTALVCWGCHNKVLQMQWLKITKMYWLIVLEARNPRSRCGQSWVLLRAVGKNLFQAPSLRSGGFTGHLRHSLTVGASPRFLLSFSHDLQPVCLCPNFLFL